MNFNLKNKKVLITGSSGGIGSSLSKIFLKTIHILLTVQLTQIKENINIKINQIMI